MTGSADIVKRLPNDIGGLTAGPISRIDHELLPWGKRCHALADVLDFHKIIIPKRSAVASSRSARK
jgi:hypothetical protein